MNVLFSIGAKVGVTRGDALLLFEDVQALQPSYFPSVPRILNRIVGQLRGMAQSLPPAEKASFDKAYEAKFALLRKGIVANDTEFDADPTMRKMKMILGGKMKVINSGAAPIAPENLDFMRVVFGCHVKEGYGQVGSRMIDLQLCGMFAHARTAGRPKTAHRLTCS
jgi:long-chain acyl-CoA synthetase